MKKYFGRSYAVKIKFFFVAALLFSVKVFSRTKLSTEHPHLALGCQILDLQGRKIRSFNEFDLCLFFKDGSYIIGGGGGVRRLDAKNKTVWNLKEQAHHQLKYNKEKNEIIFLTDRFGKQNESHIRYDGIIVANAETGEIKKKFFAEDYFKQLVKLSKNPDFLKPNSIGFENGKELFEKTHFNSIQEINNTESLPGARFLVHCNLAQLTFFLDENMSKILYGFSRAGEFKHDVQISEGKLLYFQNADMNTFNKKPRVVEISDLKEMIDPHPVFENFSKINNFSCCGTLQKINQNTFLVGHADVDGPSAFFLNSESQTTKKIRLQTSNKNVHQLRNLDLTEFLKNNLGN